PEYVPVTWPTTENQVLALHLKATVATRPRPTRPTTSGSATAGVATGDTTAEPGGSTTTGPAVVTSSTGGMGTGAVGATSGGPGSAGRYDWVSSRPVTEADMKGKSAEELRRMYNWPFARHGRKFHDPSLQQYFQSQGFHGTQEDVQ